VTQSTFVSLPTTRVGALLACSLLASGCLAGPSTAIGGGPIGRAPDLREAALLPEPDSTRGVGFVIIANRRDILEESRNELNAAARSYQRLFGARPDEAQLRLTSDQERVVVEIRIGSRRTTSVTVPLGRDDRGRMTAPEAIRTASAVVLATSHEWLGVLLEELAPAESKGAGWMARERIPVWVRVGLLENVAARPVHESWMVQLGQGRDSLPSVAEMWAGAWCPAECIQALLTFGAAPGAAGAGSGVPGDAGDQSMRSGRTGSPEGRVRYVASTYSLLQFIARREGPEFMRALVTAAATSGDVQPVLDQARSFTSAAADIDRQWRVWLATFAFPERR